MVEIKRSALISLYQLRAALQYFPQAGNMTGSFWLSQEERELQYPEEEET